MNFEASRYVPESFDVPARICRLTTTEIRDLRINRLRADEVLLSGGDLRTLSIRDSFIGTLDLSAGYLGRIELENCWIGTLSLNAGAKLSGKFVECGFFCVKRSHNENQFRGPLTIRDTWFCRDHGFGIDVQDCRNIRKDLAEKGLIAAAGEFHAIELALKRRSEPFIPKTFNWLYEVISDYGNSIGRPLAWLFLIWVALALASYFFGASEADATQVAGWRSELKDNDLARAMVLSAQSVLNPFGIFGRPVVVASDMVWAVIVTAVGLVGTATLFFAALALRRRFRLSD